MLDTKIQLASEKNLAELLPFVRSYHKFEEINLTEKKRASSLRTLLRNKSLGEIWLVYSSIELVGYIVLCTGYSIEFAGVDAFIDEFYIEPKFRGKGIGKRVLELVKVEAKKTGIRAIHLEVARTNTKAQTLYSRASFKAREKYILMSIDLYP